VQTASRVLVKFENGNTGAGSKSTAFQIAGGTTINWTMGIDGGLNGNNNFYIRDEIAGTERLLIDDTGRWGIRNNSPACPVDITGAMRTRPMTLTDAATVATDASLSNVFRVTLTANRTLGAPTNATDGQRVRWEVTAGGGAARTLTLATGSAGAFKFGTTITALSATTSGLTDMIEAVYNSTINRWCVVEYSKGF
jgi:hypothetical protein